MTVCCGGGGGGGGGGRGVVGQGVSWTVRVEGQGGCGG